MPSLIDLTGNKYGRLTVLSKAPSRHKHTFWNVKCDCGNEVIVQSHYMKSGRTKSCGCYQKEVAREVRLQHGRATKENGYDYKLYTRETHIKRKYGLSIDEYNQMLKDQDNKCVICSYEFGKKPSDTYVDHNHSTGKVRGLLCQHCNSGLGYFRDNEDNLVKAIKYLQERK